MVSILRKSLMEENPDKVICIVDYVWIDEQLELKSSLSTITISGNYSKMQQESKHLLKLIPDHIYKELVCKPKKVILDPLRNNTFSSNILNLIVLCDCYRSVFVEPLKTNHRSIIEPIFDKYKHLEIEFGFDQEYFFVDRDTGKPFSYTKNIMDDTIFNDIECSIDGRFIFGTNIAEEHYSICLQAGIPMGGLHSGAISGQWLYKLSFSRGLDAADCLWLSRYLLYRVADKYNVGLSFHPYPINDNLIPARCYVHFSTNLMRNGSVGKTGLEFIKNAIIKLSKTHSESKSYNKNKNLGVFTWGTGCKEYSINIPLETERNKKGFIIDKRPVSNCDPYGVCMILLDSVV